MIILAHIKTFFLDTIFNIKPENSIDIEDLDVIDVFLYSLPVA